MDVDAPLSYEFSYETQGVKVVLFYRTIGSRQAVSDTDWLAMGDENNEYKLNVSVEVKDFFGSKSVQVMTVQVTITFYLTIKSILFTLPLPRGSCLKKGIGYGVQVSRRQFLPQLVERQVKKE